MADYCDLVAEAASLLHFTPFAAFQELYKHADNQTHKRSITIKPSRSFAPCRYGPDVLLCVLAQSLERLLCRIPHWSWLRTRRRTLKS